MLTLQETIAQINQIPLQDILAVWAYDPVKEIEDTVIYQSPFAVIKDQHKVLLVDTSTNEFYDSAINVTGRPAGLILLYYGITLEELHNTFQSVAIMPA
jgi:hypothetical protein